MFGRNSCNMSSNNKIDAVITSTTSLRGNFSFDVMLMMFGFRFSIKLVPTVQNFASFFFFILLTDNICRKWEDWTDFYCFAIAHIMTNDDVRNCLSIIGKAATKNISHKNLIYCCAKKETARKRRWKCFQLARDLSMKLKSFILLIFLFRLRSFSSLQPKTIMLWHRMSLSNNWIMFQMHDNNSTWVETLEMETNIMLATRQKCWQHNMENLLLTPFEDTLRKKKQEKLLSIYFWSLETMKIFCLLMASRVVQRLLWNLLSLDMISTSNVNRA